ncbi:LytTR family DNA-binding domain-containing protein [Thermaurantiacus sp.]
MLQTVALASAAAILLTIASGPFFTGMLPIPARTLFWASLISWNALKWLLWYHILPPRLPERGQWLVPIGGALLLNASLPLEIAFAYRAIGVAAALDPWTVYLLALLMSGAISLLSFLTFPRAVEATAPPAAPPRGLAARVPLNELWAVTAEDHYVRLHLSTGEKPLLLYRFSDALADLAAVDGLQVHRSAWVAAGAVAAARRAGRRWLLRLPDGTEVPVSEARAGAVRAKGWLGRPTGRH